MNWIQRGFAAWRRWPLWGRVASVVVLGAVLFGPFLGDGSNESDSATPVAATEDTDALSTNTVVESESSTTTSTPPPAPTTTTTGSLTLPPAPSATSSTSTTAPPSDIGSEAATVTKVVDGDTIEVMIEGQGPDTVRLIGINAPEDGECLARESGTALGELLEGEEGTKGPFTMTSDVSNRDQYGRLLRYLWLEDGTFVNEFMVRWGAAIARDYPPDSGHAARLTAAQALAEADLVGLWVPDACGTATEAQIVISGMHPDAAGNDHENKNDEWVDLTNTGPTAVELTGWVLKDKSSTHRFHFPPTFSLEAGAEVRIFTGCGSDTAAELYWCNNSAVWNNDGDTAFILDDAGNIVDSRSY